MKKGQFKIQQMAFMILGVILFFILVALFWVTIQYHGLRQESNIMRQQEAEMIAHFLSGSSEFSCPNEDYCVDSDKLMVLMNRSEYDSYWPVSYIKVVEVYPGRKQGECDKKSYPDCSIYNIYKNKKVNSTSSIDSYVSLCRYEKINGYSNRVCDLGKLIIGYEVKY